MGIPRMSWLEHWLSPVIPAHPPVHSWTEFLLMGVSTAGAVIGISFALHLYRDLQRAEGWKTSFAGLFKLLENKWYIDEVYEVLIVRPIRWACDVFWKVVDVNGIDRFVLSMGRLSEWSGQTLRLVQTGSTQVYAFVLVLGLIASVGYLLYGMV